MVAGETLQALRALAADLDRVDGEVYAEYGRDPLEPVIGEGDPLCRVALFGRDPGRQEIRHGLPFVGAGGQKVRAGLHEALTGEPLDGFEASLWAGQHAWWANTVPYKPLGNKAWPMGVVRAFRPHMLHVLVHGWRGRDVLVLGRVALLWFGLDSRQRRKEIEAFWKREDVFEASLPWTVHSDGVTAELVLHPLPHPSPLNARWAPHFPRLLRARLDALGYSQSTWRLDEDEARAWRQRP